MLYTRVGEGWKIVFFPLLNNKLFPFNDFTFHACIHDDIYFKILSLHHTFIFFLSSLKNEKNSGKSL